MTIGVITRPTHNQNENRKKLQKLKKMTKITKTLFKNVLDASLGTQTDIAKRLNVSDSAVKQYLERNADMKQLLDEKRLNNVNLAEDVLFEQLNFFDDKNKSSGEKVRQNSAQYILSRIGKNKGWADRQEIEHSGNVPVTINLIEKSNEEIKDGKLGNKQKTSPNPEGSG